MKQRKNKTCFREEKRRRKKKQQKHRNMFLFIGDGMSYPQFQAASVSRIAICCHSARSVKALRQEKETVCLTREEQKTMMTLWCMFRSPLMIGAELTKMDDFTLSFLTNKELLVFLPRGVKNIYCTLTCANVNTK